MKYEFNGRNITIPDETITKSMKLLEISKEEAIQMYLEDEGYITNETVEELTKKAKAAGTEKITAKSTKPRKKSERKRKPDEEKELIIDILANTLIEKSEEKVINIDINSIKIVNKGKIIEFSIGNNHYKLDLIKKRPPKQ